MTSASDICKGWHKIQETCAAWTSSSYERKVIEKQSVKLYVTWQWNLANKKESELAHHGLKWEESGCVRKLTRIVVSCDTKLNWERPVRYGTINTFYGTRYLSHCPACFAFNPLFVNWVTSLTHRVTWCHRSRDHWNHSSSFPICHPLTPCPYLAPLPRY